MRSRCLADNGRAPATLAHVAPPCGLCYGRWEAQASQTLLSLRGATWIGRWLLVRCACATLTLVTEADNYVDVYHNGAFVAPDISATLVPLNGVRRVVASNTEAKVMVLPLGVEQGDVLAFRLITSRHLRHQDRIMHTQITYININYRNDSLVSTYISLIYDSS